MNFIKKNMEPVVFFSLIIFSIFMIIVVNAYDGTDKGFDKDIDVEVLTNGWTFAYNGNNQKVSLPVRMNIDSEGDGTSISKKLSEEISDNSAICFRTSHSRVQVLIDDEVIYEYMWDDEIPLGNSPGSLWNIIDMNSDYSGKTLTIKTNSPYDMYEGLFRDVIYGDKTSIMMYLKEETLPMYFLSCIPIVLGVILIVVAIFAGREISRKPFVYVGIFMIIEGIWETTESGYLQFHYTNTYTLQIINLLTFGIIPLLVMMALKYTNLIKYYFKKLFYINAVIYVMYILVQLLGIADMHQILWLVHLSMVIDSVIIFLDTKKYYMECEAEDKLGYIYIMITYGVLLLAIIIDLYRIYIYPNSYNGYATRIGMVIFITLMAICVVQRSLAKERKNVEKETIINMAYTDILTGIKNRRCFEEDSEKLVNAKKSFYIVAVDMNNLKMINDELGHKFGDEALIKVAEALKTFQKYGEECYRMGGDEFEVICRNLDSAGIDEICEDINKELAKTEYFPGIPLSVAYGSFRFSANMDTEVNKAMANADKRMYEKKMEMKKQGYATRG